MTIVHTLGPKSTDSYAAAATLPAEYEIQLHDDFDTLIAHLQDYVGDTLLLPAAYQSQQPDFGWRELAYQYWQQLKLRSVFALPLKPMCIIENPAYQLAKAVVHPATENLLRSYLDAHDLQVAIGYAGSKAQAYTDFVSTQARFTVASAGTFVPGAQCVIRATYKPEMVWCLYQIRSQAKSS
ncbi:hypothetical protein ACFQ5J_03375 [Lacticaseibacillus baoqingensis]|uniref:Prephenate dehydratase n=1 Tax=Lacticaseibacillus baoqingensis TaxID=2486013 RepID=A0ABW4E6B0_9LACO|nr:hypothetical protein [Lacticaseibacillus baoqingensis]